ncbi:6-hydroxymethylpterin diphosphokinase MptE-like [Spirosomataceae bacterium]
MNLLLDKLTRFCIRYLQKVKYYIWTRKHKLKNIERLLSFRKKYQNRRCFILGNGPSLLKCDLSLLKNEITIASNANFLIWDKMGFSPSFLTVEDNLVAEDRSKDLSKISSTVKIFPEDLLYCLKPDENTIFLNFKRNYEGFPKFSEKFEEVVYWGGTVSYLNLQLAYFLGCTEIYLIGFDHSYHVPDKSKISNFVITSQEDDVNHIHPDYFGKGYRWHDPMLWRMEMAYEKAKDFFIKQNISIFNSTVGGSLEIFERKDYKELFNK